MPEDADRDNIVVVTGFMPAWWGEQYGLTFGREFHSDPEVHRATLSRMEAILHERFGDLPNFYCGDEYANSYPMERRYGDALIPALFGCQVSFEDASGHPFAVPLNLTADQVDEIEPPDVANHPLTRLVLPEHRLAGWRTTGELGFEGVINIAYKLRGQDLFLDMVDTPARARHLFDVIWRTIDDFVHRVRAWQDPWGGGRPISSTATAW